MNFYGEFNYRLWNGNYQGAGKLLDGEYRREFEGYKKSTDRTIKEEKKRILRYLIEQSMSLAKLISISKEKRHI